MKIGDLEFKGVAADKPLAISPTGDLMTASDLVGQPTLGYSTLLTLDDTQKLDLAVKRYEMEDDFRLGIVGLGVFTRDEVIDNMRAETAFGKQVVQAEIGYVNDLVAQIAAGGKVAEWQPIPREPIEPWPEWRRRKTCIWLRLKTRALFCENTTDGVTTPFANYRIANVHPVFAARGFIVDVLSGADDVRANFVPKAKNSLTVYLSGIGHGNYGLYTGHWGDHILEVGHYDAAEVNDKSIHFLSCRTGRDLGPDCVGNGAKSYAGYSENFHLIWDVPGTSVDEFELFAKSDSTYDIEMANGATAQQAYDATIAEFNACIALVPGSVAATWLSYDRDHLVLHGDPEATILPVKYVKFCFPFRRLEEEALAVAGELSELPR